MPLYIHNSLSEKEAKKTILYLIYKQRPIKNNFKEEDKIGRHKGMKLKRTQINLVTPSCPCESKFHSNLKWKFYLHVPRSSSDSVSESSSCTLTILFRNFQNDHFTGLYGLHSYLCLLFSSCWTLSPLKAESISSSFFITSRQMYQLKECSINVILMEYI